MRTIQLGGVDIQLYEKGPVGISVSGGADSALMLYILASNIKQPIHAYTFLSDDRIAFLSKPASAVVNRVKELTGATITHTLINNGPDQLLTMFSILTEKMDAGEFDMTYTGVTSFPPEDVHRAFKQVLDDSWHYDFRRKELIKPLFGLSLPEINVFADERVYNPFINSDKKVIASIYDELDIKDTLFPYTKSCEQTLQLEGHCGKCWWCQERIWGFGHI